MSERKPAIINISKALLNVSLTTLSAIAGATGNVPIAGAVAFTQAALAPDVLKSLLAKRPQEQLPLPVPRWWTQEPLAQSWQNVCSHIENQLPSILSGVEQHLAAERQHQNIEYLSSNAIQRIFVEQVSSHLSIWEVGTQERYLVASYVTPLLLEKTANALKDAIDTTRQDALAQWMIQIADKLDAIQQATTALSSPTVTSESTNARNAFNSGNTSRTIQSEPSVPVHEILKQKMLDEAYDVYMCYGTDDELEVMQIGAKLKERGILPWFDELSMRPGQLKMRQQETQILKVPAAAVFLGKELTITGWRELQMYSFISQFIKRGLPVIPVLLASSPEQPELPPYLDNFAPVDFHHPVPDPLDQLVENIIENRP